MSAPTPAFISLISITGSDLHVISSKNISGSAGIKESDKLSPYARAVTPCEVIIGGAYTEIR